MQSGGCLPRSPGLGAEGLGVSSQEPQGARGRIPRANLSRKNVANFIMELCQGHR